MSRRQGVIRFTELERYFRTHVNVKRRNHHHDDNDKVRDHNYRLAPRMRTEPPAAGEMRAHEKAHAHEDFEEQNQIRVAGSRRAEESRTHRASPPCGPLLSLADRKLRDISTVSIARGFGRGGTSKNHGVPAPRGRVFHLSIPKLLFFYSRTRENRILPYKS